MRWWAFSSTRTAVLRKKDMYTLGLLLRGENRMPRFPLTKSACWGPDKIRLCLLAGTSALNTTLSNFADKSPTYPFDSCDGTVEDPT